MSIQDAQLMFTGRGTSGYAPTLAAQNLAPFTVDLAPLGLPVGSGGASTPGYNAGVQSNAGRDMGIGGEMWLEVLVITSVAQAADNATFQLLTDADPAMGSPVVLLQSPALAAATLVAGYRWLTQLPASLIYERYLGLAVLITTTAWTAGVVEGKLLQNIQASDLYDTGFVVR